MNANKIRQVIVIGIFGLAVFSCKNTQELSKPDLAELPKRTPSFVAEMEKVIAGKGIDEAMVWFRLNKGLSEYDYNESELRQIGYNFLYKLSRPEDAIEVFNLSVAQFPESSSAYASRAEAYLKNKDYDLSIESYTKSMELSEPIQFYQLGFLPSKPYSETKIPSDTTELFVSEGDWANDTAFVYLQGGPDVSLQINEGDALHLMPNSSKLLKIYPVQSQILNPDLLIANPVLTPEQSAKENEISAEILSRTISYLKGRGKRVFLIGHSYGASICLEYLNSKANLADKVVIMGLDLNEDIRSWAKLNPGEYMRWEDGERPVAKAVFGWVPSDYPVKDSFDRFADNLTALVKSNMQKDYTEILEQEDFDKLISVYAKGDEANGRKSKSEIDFLKSKNVTVVSVEGNHHSMLTAEFMRKVYENITAEKRFDLE